MRCWIKPVTGEAPGGLGEMVRGRKAMKDRGWQDGTGAAVMQGVAMPI